MLGILESSILSILPRNTTSFLITKTVILHHFKARWPTSPESASPSFWRSSFTLRLTAGSAKESHPVSNQAPPAIEPQLPLQASHSTALLQQQLPMPYSEHRDQTKNAEHAKTATRRHKRKAEPRFLTSAVSSLAPYLHQGLRGPAVCSEGACGRQHSAQRHRPGPSQCSRGAASGARPAAIAVSPPPIPAGTPPTGPGPRRRCGDGLLETTPLSRPSPHIVGVPARELADVLIHVLEAFLGLLQLLLQRTHRHRHTARRAA